MFIELEKCTIITFKNNLYHDYRNVVHISTFTSDS